MLFIGKEIVLLMRLQGSIVIYREGNCPADALARWGCLMDDTFVVFNHPPCADILCLINSNLAGNCNVRIVRTVCNGLTSSVG